MSRGTDSTNPLAPPDSIDIGFGALPPLPEGYRVVWSFVLEHYIAEGPGDWESASTCSRFQARRWCFIDAAEQATE